MSKLFKSFFILIMSLSILGCDQDPCDVAHTIIDGECIPDYIFPPNQQLYFGDRYYHPKYEVIVFKNGNWFDVNDEPIEELNTKKN